MEISPAQSRAARALVNLSQLKLARLANLSESMLRHFDKRRRMPTIDELEAIRRALEAKGVTFGERNGDDPGVRLSKADSLIRATWDPPPASPTK